MELFGTLCVLYALQCVVRLPQGACLFVATLFGWVVSPGPGLRMLPPLPSARSPIGRRLPLDEEAGRLRGRGGATWLAREPRDGSPVDRAALRGASAHEAIVRVGGRAFARGVDPTHAESIAALLREIGAAEPPGARQRIETALREMLSLAGFQNARKRVDADTRLLRWTSNVYWISLFALLPILTLSTGTEYTLRLLVPVWFVLHLATLFLFARAHGRLFPARRGERVQALVSCALYPPSLLRTGHDLRESVLGAFHPAAIAAAVLPRERGLAFLRSEIVRASERAHERAGSELGFSLAELEAAALRRLLDELGEPIATLLAAPVRQDPWALAYCPACLCEYRRADGPCTDCGVALARLPDAAGSAHAQSR